MGVDDKARQFIRVVLKDTEAVWTKMFWEQVQGDYQTPKPVICEDSVRTGGCGVGSFPMGLFYCPGEQVHYVPRHFPMLRLVSTSTPEILLSPM